ncbi:MAG: PQQ-dependent sugar dehydrogenase [Gammaproteobacteria bacterium]|jgi:glucose/arabinose dehydrogenase|nr:PQQ-dependent sugar dehydrogenase [Gammaproteobacteria bacterium]MBT5334589.1 PQQ-dependent sugar dehydrogenase [Gammaproteobacteria bacterium]MBT5682996.1 PQQ-dependent sugar dehydrogenase [Gammaproteobacteria bacterium]MBT6026157.1 PQQ-dependent sugar dehydrogenase [Gammaproteobacteria bacterium]
MKKAQELFKQISLNFQIIGTRLAKSFALAAIVLFTLPTNAEEQSYRLETLAEGLNFPWSVDFLPNGDLLVAELEGTLKRISKDGSSSNSVSAVPTVYRASQGGLFDVLLDKDFATNSTLYLSYAEGDSEENGTTVARATLTGNALTDVEVIFTASPRKYAPLHYGGRMAFTSDDLLLITTGDGFDFREHAQDLNSHLGKTIRINKDGSPAQGNPFPEAPKVWTYGHRNPQGLAIALDGTVYLNEHGPKGGDELNVITKANNYGWPAITYGMDYNGAYVSPLTEYPGMQQPQHVWTPSIGPSGMAFYEGNKFPKWQNSLFVGALVNKEVRRLTVENQQVTAEETVFAELDARIRDIRVGPDGLLYIVTDGDPGTVIRVHPE